VVSEDTYFVGCRTVEQLPPCSRRIILIQVENSKEFSIGDINKERLG
jgi:hypothetical protein